MANDRIVLAYSGGLDTTVAVPWLREKYGADIVTLTADLGMVDLETVRQRALSIGAVEAVVVDGRQTLVEEFLFPSLQAGTVYEEQYPLATALGRPLIARYMVQAAREHGAYAVAHGCTGKGNDQVRLEVGVMALDPDLQVIAPIRDWGMSREDEIEYGLARNLPINTRASRFSTDENLWGRSIESGVLEDAWHEPPKDVWLWTTDPADAPDQPLDLEIGFRAGVPVSLDGEEMDGVQLITRLHEIGGRHGIGRADHIENRLIGIKSREIYEMPAAEILHRAHYALETMTLTRDQMRFKAQVSAEYARMVYDGLWFSGLHRDLAAFLGSNQEKVTGSVRMRLHKGHATVTGRSSEDSLYRPELATYGADDSFDHNAAVGFIKLHGLSQQTQAQLQLGAGGEKLLPPGGN